MLPYLTEEDLKYYQLKYLSFRDLDKLCQVILRTIEKGKLIENSREWSKYSRIVLASLSNYSFNYLKISKDSYYDLDEESSIKDFNNIIKVVDLFKLDEGCFGFERVYFNIDDFSEGDVVVRTVYKNKIKADDEEDTYIMVRKQILLDGQVSKVDEVELSIVDAYKETVWVYK